jgi:hypothetical protein
MLCGAAAVEGLSVLCALLVHVRSACCNENTHPTLLPAAPCCSLLLVWPAALPCLQVMGALEARDEMATRMDGITRLAVQVRALAV